MQKVGELPFQQVHNLLLAGKQLVLHFPNATAAETFRTRMQRHKKDQETKLERLGLWSEEDKSVLSFKIKEEERSGEVVAYVHFAPPSPLKKYPVIILEEGDIDGAAQVSAVVG